MIFPAAESVNYTTQQNGGLNGGLNEEIENLLFIIKNTPGIQLKNILALLENISKRTLERQLSQLTERGLIERRGSKKTGGYWKIEI